MIRVDYDRDNSRYTLRLRNLSIGNNSLITIKFDTGAINTVIGIRTLFKYMSINDKTKLLNAFENSGIESEPFHSASGDELIGYPCIVHNVEISGEKVKNFCFYLIINTDRPIALLGDDFISCCDFSHNKHEDIIINDFDDRAIYSKFLKKSSRVLELDEIVNSIDSDSKRKDEAAGFDKYVESKIGGT